MTVRQINLALRTTGVLLCALAIASALLGIILPLESPAPTEVSTTDGKTTAHGPGTLGPLESFSGIWANPLRRPLGDAPDVDDGPQVAPATGVAAVPFTLVGTIGSSLAMLKGPDGSIQVMGVGDEAAGAQVISIRPAQVDISFGGHNITLDKIGGDVDATAVIHAGPSIP